MVAGDSIVSKVPFTLPQVSGDTPATANSSRVVAPVCVRRRVPPRDAFPVMLIRSKSCPGTNVPLPPTSISSRPVAV